MKRFGLLFLASAALTLSPLCRGEIEKKAIVTDHGMELFWWPKVETPAGFVHAADASEQTATNMFVQVGGTFANSETVIYARAMYKPRSPEVKSLRMLMDNDIADSKAHNANLVIATAPALADGKAHPVLTFTPNGAGNWEAVAYGEEGDYFLLFTISSRTKKGYDAAWPTYCAMIAHYRGKGTPAGVGVPSSAPVANSAPAASTPN